MARCWCGGKMASAGKRRRAEGLEARLPSQAEHLPHLSHPAVVKCRNSRSLPLDTEDADSRRDDAIHAESTGSREDQPNQDQHVQNLREVEEVVETVEETFRLDGLDRDGGDCDGHIR